MLKVAFMLSVLPLTYDTYFSCVFRNLWDFIKEYVGLKDTDKLSDMDKLDDCEQLAHLTD